jgi:hypothetical protein
MTDDWLRLTATFQGARLLSNSPRTLTLNWHIHKREFSKIVEVAKGGVVTVTAQDRIPYPAHSTLTIAYDSGVVMLIEDARLHDIDLTAHGFVVGDGAFDLIVAEIERGSDEY